ncbi:MAG: phosphoribosylanthranilate isomerase [Thermoguttaceae bacterium]|nr:phosphoribosylanthranilate isomerase [Thermoguttaceae bacterium]
MTQIKICGLFRDEDIGFARDANPDYAGFILNFPKSRRNLSPERAARFRARLPEAIRAVGVFVGRPVDEIVQAARLIRLDVIQLHGSEGNAYIRELREKTSLPIWKAFRVSAEEDLAAPLESAADAILLDSGQGTGQTFDWSLLAGFPRPFILAGGLTPDLIPEAVRRLHPQMIDLSSGVETGGVKDRTKMIAAVQAAHSAIEEAPNRESQRNTDE